jgi:hypothetical protein
MSGDIPANWLAVILAVFGAITGAIGFLWREKGSENKLLREECGDLRKRIEALQNEKLELVKLQLEAVNKRRETDERLASNLDALQGILKAKFGMS